MSAAFQIRVGIVGKVSVLGIASAPSWEAALPDIKAVKAFFKERFPPACEIAYQAKKSKSLQAKFPETGDDWAKRLLANGEADFDAEDPYLYASAAKDAQKAEVVIRCCLTEYYLQGFEYGAARAPVMLTISHNVMDYQDNADKLSSLWGEAVRQVLEAARYVVALEDHNIQARGTGIEDVKLIMTSVKKNKCCRMNFNSEPSFRLLRN